MTVKPLEVHASFCQYHLGGDLGNYHLQGAFTPQLPDLRTMAASRMPQWRARQYKRVRMFRRVPRVCG